MAKIPEKPMAKRVDVAVKIDAEVVRQAKIVAAYREQTLAEYLSAVLGPVVARDLAEEAAKEIGGKAKGKGGQK